MGLGNLYLHKGDLEAAIRLLDRGLALWRAVDERTWGRRVTPALGYAYALTGRLAEGRAFLEEGCRTALRIGELVNYSRNLAWLSAACLLQSHVDEACRHAWEALAVARQQGTRGYEALALYQLGEVHAQVEFSETKPAEAQYRQALALAEELGMRPLVAHCHHGLGTL